MNIVILSGQLSSPPRRTELPSGTVRWALELSTPGSSSRSSTGSAASSIAATLSVPVTWEGVQLAGDWSTGTPLVVAGVVRRRFFRAGGTTQSRTEVVARCLVEVTRRRDEAAAMRSVMRDIGRDEAAWLRSHVGVRASA